MEFESRTDMDGREMRMVMIQERKAMWQEARGGEGGLNLGWSVGERGRV